MTKRLEQLIKTIILGVVQGLTEWLPISSTGHLKLFENFLNLNDIPILFDVILHVGTLIVILMYFRKEIGKILSSLAHFEFETEEGRTVPLVIVGVIPTVLIGFIFGWLIEDNFQKVLPIGIAFLFCGTILYSAKIGEEKKDSIGFSTAILMGIAQGIAIIPGISRSGITIAVALLLGVKRENAFKFSFFLSIPAILGALGYTVYRQLGQLASTDLGCGEILAGTIVSMIVGYIALKLFWKTIARGKFHLFALYCWVLGTLLILLRFFQPSRFA